MIVDTHLHYTPKDEHGHGDTVEEVLAAARAAGIDKIVQITPSAAGYDNTYGLEGARKHPSGVIGVFGRIDPTTPDLAQRLTEHMAQPGMIGVRIQARKKTPSEVWLKERTLDPLLNLCQERNIAVGFYPPDQPKEPKRNRPPLPGPARNSRTNDALRSKGVTNVYPPVGRSPEASPRTKRLDKNKPLPPSGPQGRALPLPNLTSPLQTTLRSRRPNPA